MHLDSLQFDLVTNTIADYTVQVRIDDEMLEAYKVEHEKDHNLDSIDNLLRIEIEKYIANQRRVFKKHKSFGTD